MSELPEGWAKARLRDLTEQSTGWNPRAATSQTIRYVDIEAVDNIAQRIVAARELPIAEAPSRARVAIKNGDVLFSLVRPYLKNIARVPEDLDGQVASTAFVALRPQGGVASSFLFYQLIQDTFIKSIPTYGNSPPAARDEEFLDLEIPVAPAEEQERISEKVEELLSDLDAGITALERARANLKRYRAAVLKAAVEGRLTEKWRAAHPDAAPAEKLLERILAERRKKWEKAQLAKFAEKGQSLPKGWKERYTEPAKPHLAALPKLPKGWCWATVDQCAQNDSSAITDGPFGSNLKSEHYTTSGPRVIRLQNIGDGEFVDAMAYITEQRYKLLEKHSLSARDVVVAMLGETLPRSCVIPSHVPPAIVKADCAKVSFNEELCLPEYANCALNSESVRERAAGGIKGVGRPRLNLSHVRAVSLPLPPSSEQLEIWAAVSESLTVARHHDRQIAGSMLRASRLRQAILKRAFEGKLVPQDPKDEPASELLARIRAEREGRAKGLIGRGNSVKRIRKTIRT